MDEAQLEADKNSVQWKMVKFSQDVLNSGDEKAIKKHKEECMAKITALKASLEASEGRRWSEVGKAKGGYYIGYHRAGELASIAATEAGKYYGLNVELTAGYNIGRNWAETH